MPGNSAGSHQKPHYQGQHKGRHAGEGYRQAGEGTRQTRPVSRDSSLSQEIHKDSSPDQKGARRSAPQPARKALARDANGRESETIGFIPGSADNPPGAQSCGACSSVGWRSCGALICCMVTCGFYKAETPVCVPCLAHAETSTEDVKVVPEPKHSNGVALSNPTCGVPLESRPHKSPLTESFTYTDIKIKGERVALASEGVRRHGHAYAAPKRTPSSKSIQKGDGLRPISYTSCYSLEDPDQFLDDLPDSGTDIDSLITRKLLELYKLHQIDQLAKCTSDSVFFRKTSEIAELINNIAQDYNLDEQDAECRLVHGVIRISTRKSKRPKPDPAHASASHSHDSGPRVEERSRRNGTLPDSGNDTMIETTLTSQDSKILLLSFSLVSSLSLYHTTLTYPIRTIQTSCALLLSLSLSHTTLTPSHIQALQHV
ncbi:KDF1 factor, partial [Amia calva]|nr:KDF1 factor [Amia calva]